MGFPRQANWSGLLFSSPGDLLDPGIKLRSPVLQADSSPTESQGKPRYKDERTANPDDPKVKSLSRVWLCDPMDCSPPGSSIHGILQARVLEWGAISFSKMILKFMSIKNWLEQTLSCPVYVSLGRCVCKRRGRHLWILPKVPSSPPYQPMAFSHRHSCGRQF